MPKIYRGEWRGGLHDGDKVVPLILSIGKKKATLQIQDQKPEVISGLGLVDGMMTGKARADLKLPVTRGIKADGLSLRLQLRGSKLEGEIGAEAPIPHAKDPEHIPFWTEFSRVDASSAEQ